jgi:hypothetical protein
VITEHETLRKQVETWFESYPAGRDFTVSGDFYDVQVGPKQLVRKVLDMGKLFKFLGATRFLQFCSFPMSAVDANLSAEEQKEYIEAQRTGRRTIKPVLRQAAAPVLTDTELKKAA